MKILYNRFISIVLLLSFTGNCCNADLAIYYDTKPLTYTENNQVTGMIPRYYETLKKYCPNAKPHVIYRLKLRSQYELENLFNSNTTYEFSGLLTNITKSEARWLPVTSHFNNYPKASRETKTRVLFYSPNILVVARKSEISVENLIAQGIINCRHVAVMAAFLAVFFGIAVWIAEAIFNPFTNKSFLVGASHGFWWSVSTVTTIGYGDLTPKSFAGRFIGIIGMLVGVITTLTMGAIILRTMSTNVIDIKNKKIASITNSFDAKIVKENYDATIKGYVSINEVLNAVRTSEADYGIINSDIASYMKKVIEDYKLKVVMKLPFTSAIAEESFHELVNEPQNVSECIQIHRRLIENEAIVPYRRNIEIETVYYPDMLDFISEEYILYPCFSIAGLFLFGLFFEIFYRIRKHIESKRELPTDEESHTGLNGFANGNAGPTAKVDIEVAKLRNDVTYIKDNMIKLSAMSFYKEKCPACSWQS